MDRLRLHSIVGVVVFLVLAFFVVLLDVGVFRLFVVLLVAVIFVLFVVWALVVGLLVAVLFGLFVVLSLDVVLFVAVACVVMGVVVCGCFLVG